MGAEHLAAVGPFEEVEHPTEGSLVQTRLPWTFATSGAPRLPGAPALGEHTAAVLREAGLDDEAIGAATGRHRHPVGEPHAGPPA